MNNGQVNPLVVGLTLGSVAAVKAERWNLATLCSALTGFLKVYPLAMGLLLTLCYPRKLGPRILVALAIGLALPFFFQQFDFIIREYRTWFSLLGGDDRSNWPLRIAPQDLWLMFRMAHVPMTMTLYNGLRLVLAAGLAVYCLAKQRHGCSKRHLLTVLSVHGCCWMILCGPNSEPCTYIFVGPILGWAVVDAWRPGREVYLRIMLGPVAAALLLPLLIRIISSGENNGCGVMPLGVLLLSLHMLLACRKPILAPNHAEASTDLSRNRSGAFPTTPEETCEASRCIPLMPT
jgi:hypothetical protein